MVQYTAVHARSATRRVAPVQLAPVQVRRYLGLRTSVVAPNEMDCTCLPGYFFNNEICSRCVGSGLCTGGLGSDAVMTICPAGTQSNGGQQFCKACAPGNASAVGQRCQACGPNKKPSEDFSKCICRYGHYNSSTTWWSGTRQRARASKC